MALLQPAAMALLDKRKTPYILGASSNKVKMRTVGRASCAAPRQRGQASVGVRRARRERRTDAPRWRPRASAPAHTPLRPQVCPDVSDGAPGAATKGGAAISACADGCASSGGAPPVEAPSSWADLPDPLLEIIFRQLQDGAAGELKPKVRLRRGCGVGSRGGPRRRRRRAGA
jgi:hypothetical protein